MALSKLEIMSITLNAIFGAVIISLIAYISICKFARQRLPDFESHRNNEVDLHSARWWKWRNPLSHRKYQRHFWHTESYYNNYVQNMYSTAAASATQQDEDDRVNQQMPQLLTQGCARPTIATTSATFRIDLPKEGELVKQGSTLVRGFVQGPEVDFDLESPQERDRKSRRKEIEMGI